MRWRRRTSLRRCFARGVRRRSTISRRVQQRREFPTRMTQRLQMIMQDRVMTRVLALKRDPKPPLACEAAQPLLGSCGGFRRALSGSASAPSTCIRPSPRNRWPPQPLPQSRLDQGGRSWPASPKPTRATVIPGLRYRDARAAIEFLCNAFGFEKGLIVDGPNNTIAHAQLTFGNGMIMLGSHPHEGEYGEWVRPPEPPAARQHARHLCRRQRSRRAFRARQGGGRADPDDSSAITITAGAITPRAIPKATSGPSAITIRGPRQT